MTDAESTFPTRGVTRIGVAVPFTDADELSRLEALGLASLWVGGPIAAPQPTPEPITALAAVAAHTTRPLIGTAILPLPMYPPAIVAKQIAEIDRVANGRVILGIGVGGEFQAEFDLCGVPVKGRGRRTDESIDLLRRLWSGEAVTANSSFFAARDVRVQPPPARPGGPPIVVAGRQEAAMRRAALLGDGWMPYLYSARRYASSVATVREMAAEADRDLDDFEWLVYLFVSVGDTTADARTAAADYLGGFYQQDFDRFVESVAAVGTPEQVAERFQAYIDAGADHIIVTPCAHRARPTGERVVAEVAPLLVPRAAASL